MSPDSPHYQFDPESLGWLHRKVKEEDYITPADLARIGQADRSAFTDPVYQQASPRDEWPFTGRLSRRAQR